MELSTRQHDPAEVVGTPTARVDLEDRSDKIEAASADDLCDACKSAHVGLYFTCPERIEGYRSNGNVTLVAAQRIVSDEFDQCNACHPDICLPGQKSQEEMKELPTPVHVTETPALNNIQTPEEADDGRTNDTVDESGQDNKVEIGGTDPTTVEAAPPVPAGVEDNSVQTNILEPSQPLDSAEKEDKPAPDRFGSIEMLCEKCKIATVGVYFTCVQRIEQYMKDNAALEEAQKTVSGEFEQCAVCDPASCRSLPFS